MIAIKPFMWLTKRASGWWIPTIHRVHGEKSHQKPSKNGAYSVFPNVEDPYWSFDRSKIAGDIYRYDLED